MFQRLQRHQAKSYAYKAFHARSSNDDVLRTTIVYASAWIEGKGHILGVQYTRWQDRRPMQGWTRIQYDEQREDFSILPLDLTLGFKTLIISLCYMVSKLSPLKEPLRPQSQVLWPRKNLRKPLRQSSQLPRKINQKRRKQQPAARCKYSDSGKSSLVIKTATDENLKLP